MAEMTKYHESELTHEDIVILDQIVLKYAVKYYAITREYPDPKNYATKVILKKLQKDCNLDILLSLGYAINDRPDHPHRPGELNQRFANDIRKTIELDFEDEDGICVDRHLLRPSVLRERVLKPLEEMGVFLRIAEQKEIDLYEHDARGPGKKASGTKEGGNRGGNPSAYVISQSLAQIKNTLKKPHAIDYIQAKIIASGLALALTKYKQSAFLYAAKIDKPIFLRMMTIGARLMNEDWTEDDTHKLGDTFQALQSLSDDQVQELAEKGATFLINNRCYHEQLSLLIHLMKF